MVAPRALVFRPLVKGNEDSRNEIGLPQEKSCMGFDACDPVHIGFLVFFF